jgi:uncharacterized protein YoaH (UPF0181 family)
MERQLRMGGGIMSLEPRQQYGLGSFVKSAVKGVTGAVKGAVSGIKDLVKSDAGKLLGIAALSFGIPGTNIGGLFGRAKMFGPATGLFGQQGIGPTFGAFKSTPFGEAIFGKAIGDTDMTRTGGLLKNKLFQGALAGTVLGGALGGGLPSDEGDTVGGERNIGALRTRLEKAYRELRYPEEEIPALVEADLAEYTQGAGGYANGGRIGFNSGSDDYESKFMKLVGELMEAGFSQQQAIEEARERLSENKANGGRIGYSGGSDDYESKFMKLVGELMEAGFSQQQAIEEARERLSENKANGGRIGYAFGNNNPEQNAINAAGIMGLPLNQNPAGATELDMRDTGGFIPPVGVKEKEDDIPAMLSNNEFVFTADAVRGMGDGDVNVGAQRMYDMMKKLENGGVV